KSVQEVRAGYSILEAMGLSNTGLEVISCPSCGRCEVDLIKIVGDLEKKLATRYSLAQRQAGLLAIRPIKLAVMGCVVNGPGEAEAADLGIAFGKHQGLFFKKGKAIRKVSSRNCVDTLLQELNKII
ncbi:MAG: flavodoxin-dependent (E)-4-hydroxy-3-methylbut-2-enyl-diphosphate synthase, partial [Candidatus Omnitrophica bacterium]|nr:flavodoxin-dependent (E)-4-hydroxy-3-methylbut-2-enyl-diphosphate synthase [Candidatus Omnitrophota bacterium]